MMDNNIMPICYMDITTCVVLNILTDIPKV